MSRVLCLTGMHRSGTSLTASWLQDCGLVIDVGGLVGPGAGNPKGHFEDREMMLLHRAEFLEQHPRSRGWQLKTAESLWFQPGRRGEAAELLRRRNARFGQWGWKDPRSLPFLQQWRQLDPTLRVLILWRPFEDVAGSLLRRSSGAKNKDFKVRAHTAIATWTAYNELARAHTIENPDSTMLVPLARVLSDGDAVLAELTGRLGMDLRSSALSARFEPDLLHPAELGSILDRRWLKGVVEKARALESDLASLSSQ